MSPTQQSNINVDELTRALEPLIRRVVREELTRLLKKEAGAFQLDPDMPLYEDMEEIKRRKDQKQTELYSHNEVWGE